MPPDIYDNPEKKYIRGNWLKAVIARKSLSGLAYVNYCTFPGKKCHDVLLLDEHLKKTKIGYSADTLTFFEQDKEILTDIRNQLPGAKYYPGYFEEFVEAAHQNLQVQVDEQEGLIIPQNYFPYDVVNLDFTGGGFKHKGEKISPSMEAIYRLFEIQGTRRRSFSLFLTFSAIMRADDDSGRQELSNCILSSLQERNNVGFNSEFVANHPNVNDPYYGGSNLAYREYLAIGIPIVIINYGFQFRFDVKCKKRFIYKGTGNNAYMVSFIFECEYLGSSRYSARVIEEIARRKPLRLKEIFAHKEDVNSVLGANTE